MDCVGRQTVKFNYNLLYLLTRYNKPDSRVFVSVSVQLRRGKLLQWTLPLCFSSRFSIFDSEIILYQRSINISHFYITIFIYTFVHFNENESLFFSHFSKLFFSQNFSFLKRKRWRRRIASSFVSHICGRWNRWFIEIQTALYFNVGYLDRGEKESSPSFSLLQILREPCSSWTITVQTARGFALTCSCFDLLVNFPPSILFDLSKSIDRSLL